MGYENVNFLNGVVSMYDVTKYFCKITVISS